MKAMLWSDLLVAKKYFVQQILLCLVVAVFVCIMTSNLYVGMPLASVMMPFSLAFTLFALDERGNWEQFRLALPLSRTDIILGRYASLAVLALIGLVLGALILGLVVAAATLFPSIPQLAGLLTTLSWQGIVLVAAISIVIILAMFSLTMPLVSRFGMTKAVRFVPLLAVVGIMVVFSLGGNDEMSVFATNLANLLATPGGTLAVAGIVLAAGLALYALSGVLSVRLYAKRQF
ncbi:MAG: ABC-2 transporter permease [Gordonibacter sp.]